MAVDKILVTGAAGQIGRDLRARLRGTVPLLRLSDREAMEPAGAGEEVVRCDLADAEGVASLCDGIDAIVHLGGQPNEADWPTILASNIVGAVNLWEGARKAGVDRVLFASSNHAIGLYRRAETIDAAAPPRPDSRYGLSKAFGEDIAALYAWKHGIRGFCIRIGSCFPEPTTKRMLSTWQSRPDFARLVQVGLKADYTYEIVYGVSRNTRTWWDNSNAYRLGYDPADDAEVFAARFADAAPEPAPGDAFQGGPYVTAEFEADPARIP